MKRQKSGENGFPKNKMRDGISLVALKEIERFVTVRYEREKQKKINDPRIINAIMYSFFFRGYTLIFETRADYWPLVRIPYLYSQL